MEDAAKQFVAHHQRKKEAAQQAVSTPAATKAVKGIASSEAPGPGPVGRVQPAKQVLQDYAGAQGGYAMPNQVPFPQNLQGYAQEGSGRRGGGAVELASAVMCPMKQGATVNEEYVFDQKLGEGSFGQVCVVTHKITGQRRACKRVSVQTETDRRLVDTEIQLLKKLDHPHIMRLSECFVERAGLFLISELCEGGTLLAGFARHGSESAAAAAMRQVLGATAYCHSRGVIHRDLKPDNVLYATKAPDSPIKVIDFGSADFLQRLRAAAGGKAMERAGTLVFMAPEMLAKGDGAYGEKVDVWAIGCILYLLITGQHPFYPGRGTSEQEIMARIRHGQAPNHPNLAAAPAAARDLTMQLMVPDPARRVSAADALRHPWLRENDAAAVSSGAKVLDQSVFDGLCKYQASSKLKRAILKLLAKEADEERVKTLREQFRTLDVQQDGFLSREELLRGLRQCQGFGDMTALDLVRLLPPDLFGEKISFTDFTAALLARQGFGKAELMAAFRRFDVRKEGKISLAALSEVLKNAGPASKLEAFKEADVGQDGAIDFDEFCALINA